jgi:hypothetical protein
MTSPSPRLLRLCAIIFAGILAVQAAWLLTAEFTRVPMPYFPSTKADLEFATAHRNAAAVAAQLGWLRGDLWTDDAIAADAGLLNDAGAQVSDDAKQITEHAAAFAPYDSRVWLLLAAINARLGWKDDKTLAQLKMSYYTSRNDIRLIPTRIQIAAQSPAIKDDELQGLVTHDVRTILLHKPNLKPIIAIAYRGASQAGRHLMEGVLAELDPKLLSELRTPKP